jgi:hypothetical protein
MSKVKTHFIVLVQLNNQKLRLSLYRTDSSLLRKLFGSALAIFGPLLWLFSISAANISYTFFTSYVLGSSPTNISGTKQKSA